MEKAAYIAQISSMVKRATELVGELEKVYNRDLEAEKVSFDALNLTNETLEKCSNILDQIMTFVFVHEIEPLLIGQKKVPKGYFPIAKDEGAYKSALGRWGAGDLKSIAPTIDEKLRSFQPFTSVDNMLYARMRNLANKKHTRLVEQKRTERRVVNVSSPTTGGAISWTPASSGGGGVVFGAGVSVMGVPIDPNTQMPIHQRGIDVGVERWVSFHFDDEDNKGEDALHFCKDSIAAVQRVVDEFL